MYHGLAADVLDGLLAFGGDILPPFAVVGPVGVGPRLPFDPPDDVGSPNRRTASDRATGAISLDGAAAVVVAPEAFMEVTAGYTNDTHTHVYKLITRIRKNSSQRMYTMLQCS